jgi:hypothetical protein
VQSQKDACNYGVYAQLAVEWMSCFCGGSPIVGLPEVFALVMCLAEHLEHVTVVRIMIEVGNYSVIQYKMGNSVQDLMVKICTL